MASTRQVPPKTKTPHFATLLIMALAPQEVGRRIAAARKAKGWTHEELARQMKVNWRTVQRWQKGVMLDHLTGDHEVGRLEVERGQVFLGGRVGDMTLEPLGACPLNPGLVDAPGLFLRALHQLGDRLVVTTPNALRVMNTLTPLTGREFVHADHVAWYSPTTLAAVLERNGWTVERMLYYRNPGDEIRGGRKAQKVAANVARRLASRHASDGLIAVAR